MQLVSCKNQSRAPGAARRKAMAEVGFIHPFADAQGRAPDIFVVGHIVNS